MHMLFGDNCAETDPRPLRRGDSLCTLDHRRGTAGVERSTQDRETQDGGRVSQARPGRLALPKMQTIIQDRVIETASLLAESDEKQPITFQHSILCQTCLAVP